jgi:hypothetical protein
MGCDMIAAMTLHSRGTKCPSDASVVPLEIGGRRECRVMASPMARLQQKKQAAVTTGSAGSPPAFPAQWC